jgi:hypothetical protein
MNQNNTKALQMLCIFVNRIFQNRKKKTNLPKKKQDINLDRILTHEQ